MLLAVLLLAGCGPRLGSAERPVQLDDVAASAGIRFRHTNGASGRFYLPETLGSGCAFLDYDGDGHPDLLLVNSGPLPGFQGRGPFYPALHRGDGRGHFTDVTRAAGLAFPSYGIGCAVGDYDNDGYPDLYITALGPNHLFHNNGNGTFTDVTRRAGVGDPRFSSSAAWFDYDRDGWPDLIVTDDERPNRLYRNNRDGTFTDLALAAGLAYAANGQARAGMGVDTGDELCDGQDSAVGGDFSEEALGLFREIGPGRYEDQAAAAGLREASLPFLTFGVLFADLDLDGWPDIIAANGHIDENVAALGAGVTFAERMLFFHNTGRGDYRERGQAVGLTQKIVGRGLALGDFNDAGAPDLLVSANNGAPLLLRNTPPPGRHWLQVRVAGTRSTRDGLGTRIEIEAGGRRQEGWIRSGSSYASQSERAAFFGLGAATRVDRLAVHWPSGDTDTLRDVTADQRLLIRERAPTPCPPPPAFGGGGQGVGAGRTNWSLNSRARAWRGINLLCCELTSYERPLSQPVFCPPA